MIYVGHSLSAAFYHSRYDHFFHFIMFSAIFESSIGSFRKNEQTFINQLSLTTFDSDISVTIENFLVKPSYTWNWVGKTRCDKPPVSEFETKTLLEVEKRRISCCILLTYGSCSAASGPPGGSVTPGEKLKSSLFSCQFLLLSRLKSTDLLKREEEGKNTVSGLK